MHAFRGDGQARAARTAEPGATSRHRCVVDAETEDSAPGVAGPSTELPRALSLGNCGADVAASAADIPIQAVPPAPPCS